MSKPEVELARGWVALQQARGFVKQKYPYFYSTLLGLIPRHVEGMHTMGVSESMVLAVDLHWLRTLEVDVAAGCLIHEVMHVLRDLSRIRAFPDHVRAGYAFDIPINDDLKRFKIKLPDWVVYSSTYGFPEGLSGEGYYELLKNTALPTTGRIGAGACGSCDGHSKDEPSDDAGRTQAEVAYFKRAGTQALRDYAKSQGWKAGDVPGSWKDLLNFDEEESVVPWQSIVSSNIGRAFGRITQGQSDYSLRRPSKRSYAIGMIRPGLIAYEPICAFIEDSSASMGHVQLKENRMEAAGAMKQLGLTDVWFLNADTHVQTKPRKITVQDLFKLPVTGRGGTDFCQAIEVTMRLIPPPDLVIYSTDGEGRAPEKKPRNTEFIWLLAPGGWSRSPCDWGIQILTTNDLDERKRYKLLTP